MIKASLTVAIACCAWAGATFAQTSPFVPDEWKFGKRQESSTLHYCLDGRDPDLPVARKIGEAIAGALLLQPKEHVIGENAVGDDLDYLYRIFLETCDVQLGFKLIPDAYPEWIKLTRPYYRASYVLAVTDPGWKSLAEVPKSKAIASTMGTSADLRLVQYLMALRAPELPPEKQRLGYRIGTHEPERLTSARRRVLDHLADGFVHEKRALLDATGVSPGVIDALVDAGAVMPVALPPAPAAAPPDLDFAAASLNEAQALAAAGLLQAVGARRFSATLLEGVTGSGKTEVYFEAVAEAVRQGGQALIMLPEIALTNQFLDRFAARFGVRPAEWHSGVAPNKRARLWHAIAKGEVAVVAGARDRKSVV